MVAYISAQSALQSASLGIDVHGHNLANLNTPGFQSRRILFSDLRGSGVDVAAIQRLEGQSGIENTGLPTDLAINGPGYFRLESDQGPRYTRQGSFHLDAEGRFRHSSGQLVAGIDPLPEDAISFAVMKDGQVQSLHSDGSRQDLGNIELIDFNNPLGLEAEGEGLFRAGEASGQGFAAEGEVIQGALNTSNVDLVSEQVGIIRQETLFRAGLQVLQVSDEMTGHLLDMLS